MVRTAEKQERSVDRKCHVKAVGNRENLPLDQTLRSAGQLLLRNRGRGLVRDAERFGLDSRNVDFSYAAICVRKKWVPSPLPLRSDLAFYKYNAYP